MYEINSPDFFDKKLIANFINSLIKLGYVSINNSDKLELSGYALNEGRYARRLLDKNMQYNILQMLRTSTNHKWQQKIQASNVLKTTIETTHGKADRW